MTELLYLDHPSTDSLEIRSEEQREVFGRLIPYNVKVNIPGYGPEMFVRGSAASIKAESVTLFYNHGHKTGEMPIGKVIELQEREDGLYGRMKIAATEVGNTVWTLVKEGVLRSFSPGFEVKTRNRQTGVTILKSMPEISLTPFPQYAGADVLSMRSTKEDQMDDDTKVQDDIKVEDPATEPVDVQALQTRVDSRFSDLEKKLDKIESSVNAPSPEGGTEMQFRYRPQDWYAALVQRYIQNKPEMHQRITEEFEEFKQGHIDGQIQTRAFDSLKLKMRALADIVGGDIQAGDSTPPDDLSGLVVEEFMGDQLVNVLNRKRPLWRNLGSVRMPRSGYLRYPSVTQHVEVSARGAQKSEIPSRAMITTNATFEANYFAGGVDISLEILRTADMDVLSLVYEDFNRAWAVATEDDPTYGLVEQFNKVGGITGADYATIGAALDTTSYPLFIAQVMEAADAVEDATDSPATTLLVSRTDFRAILAFVDANDRRLFSTMGATNADASATLTAAEISLPGGITVVKARSALWSQAVLTNDEALRVAEEGPIKVEALNVPLLGRDVGVWGRTLIFPRVPAGIVVFGTAPIA